MSATAQVGVERPALRIRGTLYPVLLPTVRDPRLHLAAVIVSLQVLGQVAFDFRLSIAQILISIGTCAVLESGIAFRRQRVVMWPASALLTGNGVAFILRVPGTEHGDWWSLRGWWIFAGTAAISLLSKYVIRFRGRHVFNPSNFGLVICFLALGPDCAEPLDFWWAPMSTWMALALAIIVGGGFAILLRLRLMSIAVGFWLTFAAGIGVLAASGHSMTARWHLGPISDAYFWWLLVSSPEILVSLFFMITDPKTVPDGRVARILYPVGVGLLAVLMIAPQTTEYWSKVAVLGALAIVCAARPLIELFLRTAGSARRRISAWPADVLHRGPFATGIVGLAGTACLVGLIVLAGIPARSSAGIRRAMIDPKHLPAVTVVRSNGVESQIDRRTALQMAADVVTDLEIEADALRRRSVSRAAVGAGGEWLNAVRDVIRGSGAQPMVVSTYAVDQMRVTLEPGKKQAPPTIVVTLGGKVQRAMYSGSPPMLRQRGDPKAFVRTFELELVDGRYVIVAARGASPSVSTSPDRARATTADDRARSGSGSRNSGRHGPRLSPTRHNPGIS